MKTACFVLSVLGCLSVNAESNSSSNSNIADDFLEVFEKTISSINRLNGNVEQIGPIADGFLTLARERTNRASLACDTAMISAIAGIISVSTGYVTFFMMRSIKNKFWPAKTPENTSMIKYDSLI